MLKIKHMKKHEKNYTKIVEYKDQVSTGELDLEINNDLFGDLANDDGFWALHSEIDKKNVYSDSAPMKIEDAIKMLEELKSKGANYVEIDYNCDHYEYTFNGLNIRVATDDEVDAENKIIEEKEKIQKKKELLKDAEKSLKNYEAELKKDPTNTFYAGLIELTKKAIAEFKA